MKKLWKIYDLSLIFIVLAIVLCTLTSGYSYVLSAAQLILVIGFALAKYIAHEMEEAGLVLERKVGWIRTRRGIVRFADKTDAERDALIAKDPLYGKIICRCEQVTESEILQAIRRPVGAKTLDAVKRRVRAGMGRCQGGFCSPLIIEILARELGIPEEEVRKRGQKAFMLASDND